MISKVFFSALVVLLVAQVALADPELCPDPADANQLVYKQKVSEIAPDFGRIQKEYFIPRLPNPITCITWSGYVTGSITAIGFSDAGIKVSVVSEIRRGFYAELEAYTKEVV